MNWGHKIGLVYVAFVVFMLTLVVLCIKQKDIFLVTDNYYNDELNYESRIQKAKNANALGAGLQIEVKDAVDSVYIDLTTQSVGSTGNIVFYRPSNEKMDYKIPINLDNKGRQKISTNKLAGGLWTIKLEWQKAGKEYYKEEKIQL